jgi:hypothetical protein
MKLAEILLKVKEAEEQHGLTDHNTEFWRWCFLEAFCDEHHVYDVELPDGRVVHYEPEKRIMH